MAGSAARAAYRRAQRASCFACVLVAAALVGACATVAGTQSSVGSVQPAPASSSPPSPSRNAPAVNAPAADAASGPLAPLAWLAGCWKGSVNERQFRETWLPLDGGMLIGAGRQVSRGQLQDYEFLRIEARADGVYFTQFSGDRKDVSFRLADTTTDANDTIFAFANTAGTFPQRLLYRRGAGGWLYETIEGTLNGAERHVIYPLRRVNCETDALMEE